jgi:hypothetical protein
MTEEKLRDYLLELNLSYYNEEELNKIYNAVRHIIAEIEEKIGRE